MADSDLQPCPVCERTDHSAERDWTMPLTLDVAQLEDLGDALWEQLPTTRPVHAVALATGGVGLAVALAQRAGGRPLASVSLAKRAFGFDTPSLRVQEGDHVVVLDNTLHTGRSALMALEELDAPGATRSVLTVVGAANPCEAQMRARITDLTGVPVTECTPWSGRDRWRGPDDARDTALIGDDGARG